MALLRPVLLISTLQHTTRDYLKFYHLKKEETDEASGGCKICRACSLSFEDQVQIYSRRRLPKQLTRSSSALVPDMLGGPREQPAVETGQKQPCGARCPCLQPQSLLSHLPQLSFFHDVCQGSPRNSDGRQLLQPRQPGATRQQKRAQL